MEPSEIKWGGFPLTKMEKVYIAIQFEYFQDDGPRVFTFSRPRRRWLDAVVADIRRLGVARID